jgi:hypothetical protein
MSCSRRCSRLLPRVSRVLACACALSLFAGCTTVVPPLNPTPNIALLSQAESLDVAFGPGVVDELDLDTGHATLVLNDWRDSLQNGFRNGFRAAFPQKREASAADMTLRIDEARAELETGVNGHIRIQYAVTLLGRDGAVLRRAAGVASRRGAVPHSQGMAPEEIGALTGDTPDPPLRPAYGDRVSADVAASIDAMYEQLANQLFPRAAGQAPCPAATHV